MPPKRRKRKREDLHRRTITERTYTDVQKVFRSYTCEKTWSCLLSLIRIIHYLESKIIVFVQTEQRMNSHVPKGIMYARGKRDEYFILILRNAYVYYYVLCCTYSPVLFKSSDPGSLPVSFTRALHRRTPGPRCARGTSYPGSTLSRRHQIIGVHSHICV
jgi:hypothetical protein